MRIVFMGTPDFAAQNLHFKLKSNRFYGIMEKSKVRRYVICPKVL